MSDCSSGNCACPTWRDACPDPECGYELGSAGCTKFHQRADLQEMLAELTMEPTLAHQRSVYVWSLAVIYPRGSQVSGWQPPNWVPMPDEYHDPEEGPHFQWPRLRVFLTKQSAEKLARRLRRYGAEVEVIRSNKVTWSSGGTTQTVSSG